jgi:mannosyltransferase OCH1-like enzyme
MSVLIPKIFHRIWLGRRPMPAEFVVWGRTWTEHNPGWEMKLWTEENLPPSRYPELIKQCAHVSQQSDIYRYEIGLQEGGVYIDTDFQCLRNIESIVSGARCFAARQQDDHNDPHAIACGFFGTMPGHPLLEELVADIPRANVGESYALGPPFFTAHVKAHPDVRLFDRQLFYPYRWDELHRRNECFPDAYAVHHWSSKWYQASFSPL